MMRNEQDDPNVDPERAPDLFGWIILVTLILFIAYVAVKTYAYWENLPPSGRFTQYLSAFLVILGIVSTVLYLPVIYWALIQKKQYMSSLGALKVYLAAGATMLLFYSAENAWYIVEEITSDLM